MTGSHEVRGSTPLCSTINDTAANESWWPFSYTPQGSNPARGRQPSGLSSEEGGARRTETRPEGADRRPPYAPPLIQRLPFGRRFCCRCEALRCRTLPFSGSAAALRPAAPPLQGNLRHRRASRCLFGDLRDKKRVNPERSIAGFALERSLLGFWGAFTRVGAAWLGAGLGIPLLPFRRGRTPRGDGQPSGLLSPPLADGQVGDSVQGHFHGE